MNRSIDDLTISVNIDDVAKDWKIEYTNTREDELCKELEKVETLIKLSMELGIPIAKEAIDIYNDIHKELLTT